MFGYGELIAESEEASRREEQRMDEFMEKSRIRQIEMDDYINEYVKTVSNTQCKHTWRFAKVYNTDGSQLAICTLCGMKVRCHIDNRITLE
jgi:hypothetical protein